MGMAEVVVNVPEGYEQEIKRLVKEIRFEDLVLKSFERCLGVELKKRLLKEIASKSRLTEDKALELGELVKDEWLRKHG
ncbi:MAG: hypothetical protein DRN08_04920 [Thermoplasmata archaeon]|nr:MAG: hypothetical protein DRN08_04920 [Thermoplasmata archaeon]